MKIRMFFLALLIAPVATPISAQTKTVNFDKDKPGRPPGGFSLALTGQGRPGVWVVTRDETAPSRDQVLAQTDEDETSYRFPLCIFDAIVAKDLDLSVKFKPIRGKKDQAAGIVWRYKDKDNYYIVRANALENNVVLYKVENGRRSDLPLKGEGRTYGKKAAVPSGQWSTLRVVAKGNLFEVYLNDAKLYEVEDSTFTEAGKVGLWTKADSVIYFDDLQIGAPTAGTNSASLVSGRVTQAPTIDGKGNDPAWRSAKPLTVVVKRVLGPNLGKSTKVSIRSVHTDTHIYFLASWEDATQDISHKTWVWNAEKKAYEEGPDREDMFALAFEHTGEFNEDMFAGVESVWDVWHWKACRTNPQGYAMDKTHRYSLTKPEGRANPYKARSGG